MNSEFIAGAIGQGLNSFVDSYNSTKDRIRQQAESDELRALRKAQAKRLGDDTDFERENKTREQALAERKEGFQYDPQTKGFIQVDKPIRQKDADYRENLIRSRPKADPVQNKIETATALGTMADTLRKEFVSQKAVTTMQDIDTSMSKIENAAKDPSAAGDLSLIYGFMRMQDPASTVREGEFATAQNAAGIPERVRNMYNKAISGERLNTAQRDDFTSQAYNLYNAQLRGFENLKNTYNALAKRRNLDPEDVTGVYRFSPRQLQKAVDKGLIPSTRGVHPAAKPDGQVSMTPKQVSKPLKQSPGTIVNIKGTKYRVLEDGDSLEPIR